MPIGQRDTKHRAGQHLRHISRQFDWFFFWHNDVERSNVRFPRKKSIFFAQKTSGQLLPFGYISPHHMKSETLNGILTFILGALVILGVIFALRVIFVTRESRALQTQAMQDNAALVETQSLLNDTQAYNQKYQSPELTRILQSLPAKPPAH
jgi:hypothetical protein